MPRTSIDVRRLHNEFFFWSHTVTKHPIIKLSGFTLIELMVVISIMAIMASIIIVAASAFFKDAKKKQTDVIMRAVEIGINMAIASKGSSISPAEHPFAGSRSNAGSGRYRFKRAIDSSDCSTTGTALKGVPTIAYLSGSQNQLMLPSDRYADKRIALLYGSKREDIGVLQSLRKLVTQYRQLPCPPTVDPLIQPLVTSTVSSTAGFDSPTEDVNWPDTMIPSTSPASSGVSQETDTNFGRLADAKSALDYLFGSSSAQAELASLKALYNADPSLPTDVNVFSVGIESRKLSSNNGAEVSEFLVYTNAGGKEPDLKTIEAKWKPGYIPVTTAGKLAADRKDSRWVRYRLAGLAVYDAWGNELLVTIGTNDKYRVLSAGVDGVLAVNPGKDNSIDTDLTGDTRDNLVFVKDDLDGAKDNQK